TPTSLDQRVPRLHRRAAAHGRNRRARGAARLQLEKRAGFGVGSYEGFTSCSQCVLGENRPVLYLFDRTVISLPAPSLPLVAVVGNLGGGVPQHLPEAVRGPRLPLVVAPLLAGQGLAHQSFVRSAVAPVVEVGAVDRPEGVLHGRRSRPVERHQPALEAHVSSLMVSRSRAP